MSILLYIKKIIIFVALILPLLLAVAYLTLLERHILAALQRRQGPNVTGFFGIFQAIADGVKLLLKESILPKSSNIIIFLFAPIISFGLALANWAVIPITENYFLCDFNFSILYIFALSSLGVHTIIMAGWSSNSKYAFLGGLRSAAQMISYEVGFGTVLLNVLLVTGSLNFSNIVQSQFNIWLCLPLFPIFILFFISALAETNRHPFDLPEAEAELVSGYNVEYSAVGFTLFFLAEYSNIILMSSIASLLFLGGWLLPFPLNYLFTGNNIVAAFFFSLKVMFIVILFILVRGTLPRYRYDQLMRLGWKIFLPFALAMVLFYASFLISFNSSVEFIR